MGESNNLTTRFAEQCGAAPIEDGKKIILVCSNCRTPLVELWRTRPTAPVKTKVVATCGLCGDKSFSQMVAGGFHIAPIDGGRVAIKNHQPGEAVDDNGTILIPLTIITEKVT